MTWSIRRALLLAGTILIASTSNTYAADTTGTASVDILSAIGLTQDTPMDFAVIIPDVAGDTVSLTTGGGITSDTGNSTFNGTPVAGVFSATGSANESVTISFSTGDTLTGAGAAMPIGGFSHDAGGSPAFDGTGNLSFNIGADLTVNASQAAGLYSGTYTVTVDYQ